MRELLPQYPWFRALLHELSINKVRASRTVHTAMSDLTDNDAINLAKCLSTIVPTCSLASTVVDHWIAQNSAMEEFEKENEWMRPFFIEISQYNLSASNLGLKLRVLVVRCFR